MKLVLLLLVLVVNFQSSDSLKGGTHSPWISHGYLVKVFARTSSSSSTFACTAVLISPRLVLTATDCVMQNGLHFEEIAVVVTRVAKSELRKRAEIVMINNTLAVLKLIHPLPVSEICPSPQSSRLSYLGVHPSLTGSSLRTLDLSKLSTTTCRIVGFESSQKASDFLSDRGIISADISLTTGSSEEYLLALKSANNVTACYEDLGAPVVCERAGHWQQIGFLSSLSIHMNTPGGSGDRLKDPSRKKRSTLDQLIFEEDAERRALKENSTQVELKEGEGSSSNRSVC